MRVYSCVCMCVSRGVRGGRKIALHTRTTAEARQTKLLFDAIRLTDELQAYQASNHARTSPILSYPTLPTHTHHEPAVAPEVVVVAVHELLLRKGEETTCLDRVRALHRAGGAVAVLVWGMGSAGKEEGVWNCITFMFRSLLDQSTAHPTCTCMPFLSPLTESAHLSFICTPFLSLT